MEMGGKVRTTGCSRSRLYRLRTYRPVYGSTAWHNPGCPRFPDLDPRPLTRANAVGRHVMVPASCWPSWPCAELDGAGWRAEVVRLTPHGAMIRFVVARASRRRAFQPVELELSALAPL